MVETVWLTRHGNRQDFVDPDWPKSAKRPYDPDLSPDGIEQARQLAWRLRDEQIACIFASPFLRTVHTAAIVAEELQLRIYLESGVAEWMNPEWFSGMPQTLPAPELAELFPAVDLDYASVARPVFPETEGQAMSRAGRTARELAETYSQPILIVGHGVSVAGAACGLVPDVEITECPLCSLFRADRREGAWHLGLCGDVTHLDEVVAVDRFN